MLVRVDYSRDSLLTQFGIETLKDRYMIPGEKSPQDAFARAALAFADNEEHAQRIYDYASKLWFMFSTPILSNGGTTRGLPISCLTAEAWIQTPLGGKQIKDIQIGDEVLTHKNRFKKVLNVKSQVSQEPIYHLQAYGRNTKTRLTGNHLVLTKEGWKRVDNLVPTDFLASNLTIDYEKDCQSYLHFKQYKSNERYAYLETPIPDNVKISNDVMWLLGWWFSEGSLTRNSKGIPNGIRFTLSRDEEDIAKKLVEISKLRFNANGNYYLASSKKGGQWISVNINSSALGKYFEARFGKNCKEKMLPLTFFSLKPKLTRIFLEAIFKGDGCLVPRGTIMTLANPKLVLQVYNLLLKLNEPARIKMDTKASKLTKDEHCYTIFWVNSKESTPYTHRSSDYSFHKIYTIKKTEEVELVYDLEVDEDSSFVANGLIVHNCYLSSQVQDSRKGLTDHYTENAFLSSMGGGIGAYWGNVRSDGIKTSKGSVSLGTIPFLKVVDAEVLAFRQGDTRRASYAAYQDISHPEIEDFIIMRKASGGDTNRKCLNLHHGVNLTDAFMKAVEKDLNWDLIDPHTKEITKTLRARELWELLLETRMQTGEPYLHFIDTVNNAAPEAYKNLKLTIPGSNLCIEISLAQSHDRTAVCCLSSVNLEYYDEWKDNPLFISDLIRFLDNVIEFFIKNAPNELEKAAYSAYRERSLGLGAMGFHAYLQKNNIPFEGPLASGVNRGIFTLLHTRAKETTLGLAKEKGVCPDALAQELQVRNLHLMAIAPNASSSIICGNTSPSIEPFRANAFTQKTLSGSALAKNKFLEALLETKGENNDETWQSIITSDGSVQHLDFLTDWEKDVFKTAIEIDQHWIVQHAADRQPYICQSQSVNLFFLPDVNVKYLHQVHYQAWKKGLKSLYYARSTSAKNAENIAAKIERVIRQEEECFSCQG